MKRRFAMVAAVALLWAGYASAEQGILTNGSMEFGPGPAGINPQIAADWTEFGTNVERSPTVNLVPEGEGHSLKAFGDGTSTSAGASQEVEDILPGQSATASVWLHTPSFDKLGGSGQAGLVLEFLNLFGGTISLHEVYPLTSASPGDTWIQGTIGPLVAPSGTAKIRITCKLKWSLGNVSGAAYWDDVQLSVDGSENLLLNGDIETAGTGGGQSPAGIDDWTGFGDQEKSEDVAEHGLSSLQLGTNGAFNGLFQDMGPVNAGDQIYMVAYLWNPSDDPMTGNTIAGIKLEFDPNGVVPPAEENLEFGELNDPDVWTQVQLVAEVPEGITIARIVYTYTGDPTSTGSVHIDNAFASRSGSPSTNRLLNPSFETGPGGPNGLSDWTEFWTEDASSCRKCCFCVITPNGICTAKATGTAVTGIFQEITVVEGETVTARADFYTPSSDRLIGPALAGVKIEWAFGGVPADVDIELGAPNTIDASAPEDEWVPVEIDYTMEEGTSAIARFTNIISVGNALSGKVYFDSCEAVVVNRFDGSDVDGDDDEDLRDFAELQRCFSGAGGGLEWNCIAVDSDDDEDVDLVDYDFFEPRLTGP